MPLKLIKELQDVSPGKEATGKAGGMKICWDDYVNISTQLGLPAGVSGGVLMDTLTSKMTEAGIPLGFLFEDTPDGEIISKDEKWVGKKYDNDSYNKGCEVLGIPQGVGGSTFFKALLLKAVEVGVLKVD